MEDKIIDALLEDELLVSYIARMVARRLPSRQKRQNDLKWCRKVVDMSISDAIEELNIVEILNGQIASLGEIVNNRKYEDIEPAQQPGFSESEPTQGHMRSKRHAKKKAVHYEPKLEHALDLAGRCIGVDEMPIGVERSPERFSPSNSTASTVALDRVAMRYDQSIPEERGSGGAFQEQSPFERPAAEGGGVLSSNDSVGDNPYAYDASRGAMDFTKTYRFDGNMLSSVRNWRDGFEEGDGDDIPASLEVDGRVFDDENPRSRLSDERGLESDALSSQSRGDKMSSPSPSGSPESIRRLVRRYSDPEDGYEGERAFQRESAFSSNSDLGSGDYARLHDAANDRAATSSYDFGGLSSESTTASATRLSPEGREEHEQMREEIHNSIHSMHSAHPHFHRTVADAILRSPNRSPHRSPNRSPHRSPRESPIPSPHGSPKTRHKKKFSPSPEEVLNQSDEAPLPYNDEMGSKHSRINCDDLGTDARFSVDSHHSRRSADGGLGAGHFGSDNDGGAGSFGSPHRRDESDNSGTGTGSFRGGRSPDELADLSQGYDEDFQPMSPAAYAPDQSPARGDDDYADDFESPTATAAASEAQSFPAGRVRFIPAVVAHYHYVDKYNRSEVPYLFYSHEESLKFTEDFNRESEKAEMQGMTWDQWWELRTDEDVARDDAEEEAELDEMDYYNRDDDSDDGSYDF